MAPSLLTTLADEAAWKKRFIEKRDVIRRMAREAIEEDDKGETLPIATWSSGYGPPEHPAVS
jgi:hypothetical protein